MSFTQLLDIFIHLDRYLDSLIQTYGNVIYAILFAVIFAETGLVATPFLPGDSLLFAVGTIAARDILNLELLVILLIAAAILGDTVNYWIGWHVGPKVFKEKSRYFKKEYLDRTHDFYERYGGITIVLARFIPIIRTFAPFVAGIGRMSYWRFLFFNVSGGIAWVVIFVLGGYFFGNLAIVQQNFSLVIITIVFVSLIPVLFEYARRKAKKEPTQPLKPFRDLVQ